MTKEDRELLKNKMSKLIVKLQSEIDELEELTQPIGPENAIGRISRMDAINNKSVSEAALRTKNLKLQKLKIAISRVDLPEFGNCNRCHNPIEIKRMLYMPESDRCIRCADR